MRVASYAFKQVASCNEPLAVERSRGIDLYTKRHRQDAQRGPRSMPDSLAATAPKSTDHFKPPSKPKCDTLDGSWLRMCDGTATVNNLATLYHELAPPDDSLDHERQDLLRAMVVMAGAAFDVTIKQIIWDCLTSVCGKSDPARIEYKNRARKLLKHDIESGQFNLLTDSLLDLETNKRYPETSDVLRRRIMSRVIDHSLQSNEQIKSAARLLGINENAVVPAAALAAIECRHQIVHDLDSLHFDDSTIGQIGTEMGFTYPSTPHDGKDKRRRLRSWEEMSGHAAALLGIGATFIERVDDLLPPTPPDVDDDED